MAKNFARKLAERKEKLASEMSACLNGKEIVKLPNFAKKYSARKLARESKRILQCEKRVSTRERVVKLAKILLASSQGSKEKLAVKRVCLNEKEIVKPANFAKKILLASSQRETAIIKRESKRNLQ